MLDVGSQKQTGHMEERERGDGRLADLWWYPRLVGALAVHVFAFFTSGMLFYGVSMNMGQLT